MQLIKSQLTSRLGANTPTWHMTPLVNKIHLEKKQAYVLNTFSLFMNSLNQLLDLVCSFTYWRARMVFKTSAFAAMKLHFRGDSTYKTS